MRSFFLSLFIGFIGLSSYSQVNSSQAFYPEEASPETIGRRVIHELISRDGLMHFKGGAHKNMVHYAEACAGMGAIRLACSLNDKALLEKLEARYENSITHSDTFPTNHVDANVFGILPFELFKCTRNEKYRNVGLRFADTQWEAPLPDGMTNQTRFWIDDIFMIGALQVQAYKATGDVVYVDRAAYEIDAYVKKLQQPNGLFHHGPNAPFFWGRGNGWVAAGLATVITHLYTDSPYYDNLLEGYQKMMKALLDYQMENGMWRQLIDNSDSWEESSCTAMFGYAMKVGIDRGLLTGEEYVKAYQKAWLALVNHLDESGKLTDICVGTGQSRETQFYLDRPKVTGDLHGQAPMLWFAGSLIINEK